MTAFELIVIAIRGIRVKKPNGDYIGQKAFCTILPLGFQCHHQRVLRQHQTQHSISAAWVPHEANACACVWPDEWLNMLPTTRIVKQAMCAGLGLWLVVMGGRTADVGWFRTKTDTFLNDVVVMDRYGYSLKHLHVLPARVLVVLDIYSFTVKRLYVLPASVHFLATTNPSFSWHKLNGI